ncbi:MAG: SDR family NAD(P)-dependent oxidoreductase [Dehalococcoidia bacterium]
MGEEAALGGKRVLVLGGETALGRALTIGLAAAGADIVIASLKNNTDAKFAINSALNELWAMQRHGLALAIDATDDAQVREAVARAERELGRLDGAAVVANDDIAPNALHRALNERPVLVFSEDGEADEALADALGSFG